MIARSSYNRSPNRQINREGAGVGPRAGEIGGPARGRVAVCVFPTVADACRCIEILERHRASEFPPFVLTAKTEHVAAIGEAFAGKPSALEVHLYIPADGGQSAGPEGVPEGRAHLLDFPSWAPPDAAKAITRDLRAGRLVLFVPAGMAWFDTSIAEALLGSEALRIELHDMPSQGESRAI